MRLLWLSNPPFAPSGYGEQTALFLPRLRELGHEPAVVANFGLATTIEWGGIPCFPTDRDWGNLHWPTFAQQTDAELAIALCDAWVLKPDSWPPGSKMAVWAPVDHEPIPRPVADVLKHERIFPIAMSRFGEAEMQKAGMEPLYVPHGVDTALFRPQADLREQAREALGMPQDGFLVGMVAANRGNPHVHRKAFPQAFDAFARFAERHEDAWMYVHASAFPGQGGGMDLSKLAVAVGCDSRVRFPPETSWQIGIGRDFLSVCYQAFDVLLSPSMGEGFGIPILEAQACGCPVIVSDHSAMRELCAAGWTVEGERFWDPAAEAFFHLPSIASIGACLEKAYEARDDQLLRKRAVAWAQHYDVDLVTERHWIPALEGLRIWADEPAKQLPKRLNRAQRRALEKAVR